MLIVLSVETPSWPELHCDYPMISKHDGLVSDQIKQIENQLTQQSASDRLAAVTTTSDLSLDFNDTLCDSDTDSTATVTAVNGHSADTPVQDSNLYESGSSVSSSLSDLTNNNGQCLFLSALCIRWVSLRVCHLSLPVSLISPTIMVSVSLFPPYVSASLSSVSSSLSDLSNSNGQRLSLSALCICESVMCLFQSLWSHQQKWSVSLSFRPMYSLNLSASLSSVSSSISDLTNKWQ